MGFSFCIMVSCDGDDKAHENINNGENTEVGNGAGGTSEGVEDNEDNESAGDLDDGYGGEINGHNYVDMGLGVKWAECNVGASTASDYGDYFAWGETAVKSEYTTSSSLTYGEVMGDISGDPQYDAARALWGGTWRLPTAEEIDELTYECSWKWTTQDGHKGCKVTGPSGESIFLPAGGWAEDDIVYIVGERGRYWSGSVGGSSDLAAYALYSISEAFYGRASYRYIGMSIRPVSE